MNSGIVRQNRGDTENKPAIGQAIALLAYHEGLITAGELRKAIRLWVGDPSQSIDIVLLTHELVTEEALMKLHDLASRLAVYDERAGQYEDELEDSVGISDDSPIEEAEDLKIARDSKRDSKRPKQTTGGLDYYDSIHEHFTRDDRVIPSLSRQIRASKRKFRQSVFQFGRSAANLSEGLWFWLKNNLRNVLLTSIGLTVFLVGGYFLADFINPNKTRPAAPTTAPERSLAAADAPSSSDDAGDSLVEPNLTNHQLLSSETLESDMTPVAIDVDLENAVPLSEQPAFADVSDTLNSQARDNFGSDEDPESGESGTIAANANTNANDVAEGAPEPKTLDTADQLLASEPNSLVEEANVATVELEVPTPISLPSEQELEDSVQPTEASSVVSTASANIPMTDNAESIITEATESAEGLANVDKEIDAEGRRNRTEQIDALFAEIDGLTATPPIQEISALIEKKSYAEALQMIDEAANDRNYDTEMMQPVLVSVLLAAKEYQRAGDELLEDDKTALEDPNWEILVTCWLMYAPAVQRTQIRQQLEPRVGFERINAWIDARAGETDAAEQLSAVKESGHRSLGDFLFLSVARRYAKDIDGAKEAFAEAQSIYQSKWQDPSEPSPSALLVARILERALVAYAESLGS